MTDIIDIESARRGGAGAKLAQPAEPKFAEPKFIDLDMKAYAAELKGLSWKEVAETLELEVQYVFGAILNELPSDGKGDEANPLYLDWHLVRMRLAITELLTALHAKKPQDAASLALFSLSASPLHRRAARVNHMNIAPSKTFHAYFNSIARPFPGLVYLFNASAISDPALSMVWAGGLPAKPPRVPERRMGAAEPAADPW